MIRRNTALLLAVLGLLAAPAAAQADFGIAPGSVEVTALNKDGTVDTEASSHPYSYTVHFDLNTDESGHTEGGALRDVLVDLPPGFIGNPRAITRCSRQLFEGPQPNCPPSTQVGFLRAVLPGGGEISGPVYNLVPPPGIATQFGFSALEFNSLQYASLRSEDGYGINFSAPDIPTSFGISSVTETIWGVPSDPGHDQERTCHFESGTSFEGCSSDAPGLPYLTMPATCDAPLEATVRIDSNLNPGVFVGESTQSVDNGGQPAPLTGCDGVPFQPKISSQPTTKLAESPSGLDFELKLPNQGLLGSGAISETEPRKTVVTLPEGFTVNPSFAEGAGVCSQAQYKAEQIDSPAGAGCPEASKLGSVIAQSPLLEEPIEGAVYLAAPYENPFGTLTALYLVARAPDRGIIVKQAGRVEFDQATGQITSTFDDLPPVPYSSFKLHFREGARAPLATPSACGEYKTVARFTPFSASSDAEAIEITGSFQIERGPDGGACPSGGLPPFRPGLIAGSINNAAGRFSPFNVRLFRNDSEQEFTRFSIKLPPGVVGKLAGVPFCSDAAIAAAKARTGIHGGAEELAGPSCPAASEIGHSLAGAGVGSALAYAPGKLYLAGPYHGSAISLVAITAAKVGPFDLGTVVIRQAFKVDPETGEVFIDATGSDPIPHIIKGVPVHARDIRAYTDRPEFVLNPSSCKRTSTASTLLGSGLDFVSEADDRPVTVSTPFQAADCAALPFKPRLALKLNGGTKRGDYPALNAVLNMNGIGEAGIRRAQVTLPRSEFIANAHFNTICTRVVFKQGTHPGEKCPAGSIYGKAVAETPILDEPLVGPVFLRSSEHQLPDVVASLHNGEIDVVLVGRVDSVKGRLRNTFEATPDAPVKRVVVSLMGGRKGLFENSTDLCANTHKAIASFTGHNGKLHEFNPVVKATGCDKAKKQKAKRQAARQKRKG
ncbi:MAG: hypothetical protein QOF85_1210 [Solirubrobacterales bacterium]|nr:hypothetical protein [Solirubrobacterales bacterium]